MPKVTFGLLNFILEFDSIVLKTSLSIIRDFLFVLSFTYLLSLFFFPVTARAKNKKIILIFLLSSHRESLPF